MFQCLAVNFPRKMNRTFSIDRIPAGWIGAAKKLYFQSDTDGRFCQGKSDDALDRLPGGAAWGASFNVNVGDLAVRYLNFEFRRTEAFFIFTQAALPGKSTSCGG